MPSGNGIFNRGESLVKAQQDYDLYSFIANKPQGRAQAQHLEEIQKDKLFRAMFDQAEDASPLSRPEGDMRLLMKMVIKSMAAFPVLILYVGPRKVAQVMVPIFNKMAHLLPQLMQKYFQQLQEQLRKITEPVLVRLQIVLEKVAQRLKTTIENIFETFNRAKEFLNRNTFGLMADLKQWVASQMAGYNKITLTALTDLVNQWMHDAKEFLLKGARQIAEDVKSELNAARLFAQMVYQRILDPIKHYIYDPIANAGNTIPDFAKMIAKKIAEGIDQTFVAPYKKATQKIKKGFEDAVDNVRQVGEMLVSKMQMMVVPLINLLAVSNEFFQRQKEKMKSGYKRRFKKGKEHTKGFAAQIGNVAERAKRMMKSIFVGWWKPAWLMQAYAKFLKVVEKIVGHLLELSERVYKKVIVVSLDYVQKFRQALIATCQFLLPLLKQIPSALHFLIEWAFGKAGTYFIEALKFSGTYLVKGFRYTVQLLREVIGELVRLGD